MNYESTIDSSSLTLSANDIATLVDWHESEDPHLSPIGLRYLTRQDIAAAILAWREKNGLPQLPIGDHYWQRHGVWRQGPNLAGLDFSNRDLSNMDLNGIILSYANLFKADLRGSLMKGIWLLRANLQWAKLSRCDLSHVSFYEADLSYAEFWKANLSGASFRGAYIEGTRFLGANLDGAYFHRARMGNTELTASQLGGSIGEERDGNYSRAVEAYSRLKANFESLGRYSDAGWAYRRERRMRKKLAYQDAKEEWNKRRPRQAIAHWLSWIGDWITEVLCDYGESAWRVIGWIALMLFIIGPLLITALGGLEWTGTNRDAFLRLPTSWQQWGYAYFQNLLYMLDTLTTASFSELKPHTDAVRIASGFIAMLGIFLVGLLGFVAGNRIRNS